MTGATGFIGSHFLLRLLSRTGSGVHATVRGESPPARSVRLWKAIERAAGAYPESLPLDGFRARVTVIGGDLREPFCGAGVEGLASLEKARPGAFWHFAASLLFDDRSADEILEDNVGGTRRALELASRLGVRRFVHVSTAYTCGSRSGRVEETLHPASGPFNNRYEESKCLAEHLVASFCKAEGMDFSIFRPSVVMGPVATLQGGGAETGVYGFFREIFRVRRFLRTLETPLAITADPAVQLNLVSVDRVVGDMLDIAAAGFPNGPIYHLTSTDNPTLSEGIEVFCRVAGIPPMHLAAQPPVEPSPIQALIDRRTRFHQAYLQGTKVFARCISGKPGPSLDEIAGYLEEHARQLRLDEDAGFFSRSTVSIQGGPTLRFLSAGEPGNPAVVLINAYGISPLIWVPFARRIGRHFRVLTWETRGAPDLASAFDPARCGPPAHAEDLRALLDHHGVDRAALVGWCTGAQVALCFASAYPDRVTGLALLNGHYSLPPDTAATEFGRHLSALLPVCARGVAEAGAVREVALRHQASRSAPLGRGDQIAVSSILQAVDPSLLHLTNEPFRTNEGLYRYANMLLRLNEEPHPYTANVAAPALVVTTRRDQIAHPDHSSRIARRLFDATLEERDGDHYAMYHDRGLADRVAEFITAVLDAGTRGRVHAS